MVQSESAAVGEGMSEVGYGTSSGMQAQRLAAHSKGWHRTALVCAMTAIVCVGVVAALQLQDGRGIALEEEIGTFGTALNTRQNQDTDQDYENTFYDDPGHISRAELRFNAALQAAGGRSGVNHVNSARVSVASAPRLSSQWTAFPDPAKSHDVTVNIEEPARKPAAPRHVGMSAAEARADLGTYFNSIDHQVKKQERRHAQQILHSLALNSRQSSEPQQTAGEHRVSPDTEAARKTRSLMKLVKKAEAGKESSLVQLVERAAHSKVFQRALVGAADSKYRGSLVGDF